MTSKTNIVELEKIVYCSNPICKKKIEDGDTVIKTINLFYHKGDCYLQMEATGQVMLPEKVKIKYKQ